MYKTKQGMSSIITMLILIALALVAIGIFWYALQAILSDTETEVVQSNLDLFGTCAVNYPNSIEMVNNTHINDSTICITSTKIVGGKYCCIAS